MSWASVEIGDLVADGIADIQTGPFGTQLKASDYIEDGVPVINVRNIGYSELRPEKIEFISDSKSEKLSVHKLEKSDIVFGRKGAVDRHLFVQESQMGWVQGSDCIRLRIDSSDVNPRFISYSFLSSYHKQWMLNQCGNKATMASLNQDVVKRIKLKLPSKTHQDIIVDMLACYDDLIENNKRRIELLEESARQLYKEWFVRFRFPGHEHVEISDGVPEGWKTHELEKLSSVVKESTDPTKLPQDTPYIGLEHMPRRSFTLNSWEHAEKVSSTKYAFKSGDILFGKIRPYFHKVGFAITDGITSSDAIVLRPMSNDVYYVVLCETTSDQFISLASKTVREGSKMPRADWGVLKKRQLLVPPLPLLEVFNYTIESIVEQCKALSLQTQNLSQARDILLPKLMSGEIAV